MNRQNFYHIVKKTVILLFCTLAFTQVQAQSLTDYENNQQTGDVKKTDLILYSLKKDNIVVELKAGQQQLICGDELCSNIAFDVYQDGILKHQQETRIPLRSLDYVEIVPAALDNVGFVYKIGMGVPACAEPWIYYYFIWHEGELKLLETACDLCEDQPYAIKEISFPENKHNMLSITYLWGELDENDSFVTEKSKTENYRWDGKKLNLIKSGKKKSK